jgi:hypothetical protein
MAAMFGGGGALFIATDFVAGLDGLFLITIGSASSFVISGALLTIVSSFVAGALLTHAEEGEGFDESLETVLLLGGY